MLDDRNAPHLGQKLWLRFPVLESFEELFLRHEPSTIFDEVDEELVDFRPELDTLLAAPQLAGGTVEVRIGGRPFRRAAGLAWMKQAVLAAPRVE